MPALSASAASLLIQSYALTGLLGMLFTLPTWRQFYLSERWRGYAESSPVVNVIQNPWVMPWVLALWLGSLVALLIDRWTIGAALLNFGLSYYFFIFMRWRGLLRGMGAPGFMMYWGGLGVLVLSVCPPGSSSYSWAVLALQVDIAIIFLSAGVSKLTAGYPQNNGMDLGMANPMWCYHYRFFRRLKVSNPMFLLLNQSAWIMQIGGAILCLIPATRWMGAIVFALMFTTVAFKIRLGTLCAMIVGALLLFVPEGSVFDVWLAEHLTVLPTRAWSPISPMVDSAIAGFFMVYIVVRPLVTVALFYNYFTKARLPGLIQAVTDRISNTFGLILWRVFTADVLDFHVQIYAIGRDGSRRHISAYSDPFNLRYNQVAEAIAVTSLFTTARYFPSNRPLFQSRLLRYCATLPLQASERALFEYLRIVKRADQYTEELVAEIEVDLSQRQVIERQISGESSIRDLPKYSKIKEGHAPGTYVGAEKGRVSLRPLRPDDLKFTFEWHNDREISDQIMSYPPPVRWEGAHRWLEESIESSAQGQRHVLMIDLQQAGRTEPIGFVTLNRQSDNGCWQLGIVIGSREWRGRGLGAMAVERLAEFARSELRARRLQLEVRADNPGAIRFYKKMRFETEGECFKERQGGQVRMLNMSLSL